MAGRGRALAYGSGWGRRFPGTPVGTRGFYLKNPRPHAVEHERSLRYLGELEQAVSNLRHGNAWGRPSSRELGLYLDAKSGPQKTEFLDVYEDFFQRLEAVQKLLALVRKASFRPVEEEEEEEEEEEASVPPAAASPDVAKSDVIAEAVAALAPPAAAAQQQQQPPAPSSTAGTAVRYTIVATPDNGAEPLRLVLEIPTPTFSAPPPFDLGVSGPVYLSPHSYDGRNPDKRRTDAGMAAAATAATAASVPVEVVPPPEVLAHRAATDPPPAAAAAAAAADTTAVAPAAPAVTTEAEIQERNSVPVHGYPHYDSDDERPGGCWSAETPVTDPEKYKGHPWRQYPSHAQGLEAHEAAKGKSADSSDFPLLTSRFRVTGWSTVAHGWLDAEDLVTGLDGMLAPQSGGFYQRGVPV